LVGISHICETNTIFTVYQGNSIITLNKIFNIHYSLGLLFGILLNKILVYNYSFNLLYKVMIAIEILGVIMMFKWKNERYLY